MFHLSDRIFPAKAELNRPQSPTDRPLTSEIFQFRRSPTQDNYRRRPPQALQFARNSSLSATFHAPLASLRRMEL